MLLQVFSVAYFIVEVNHRINFLRQKLTHESHVFIETMGFVFAGHNSNNPQQDEWFCI
jgi:hypothetical protein